MTFSGFAFLFIISPSLEIFGGLLGFLMISMRSVKDTNKRNIVLLWGVFLK